MLMSDAANDFITFALLHLTCTMFITRDKQADSRGGFFYRVLNPMGYASLLEPIEKALSMKVGRTTLREYLRNKRNRLTVHGDLSFHSQDPDVKDVTYSEESITEFNEAYSILEAEVTVLYKALQRIAEDSNRTPEP